MMRENAVAHLLKILPEFFELLITGQKLYEVRFNDRDFKKGDIVTLAEWIDNIGFTGRLSFCLVGVVVDLVAVDESLDGFVSMSVMPLKADLCVGVG